MAVLVPVRIGRMQAALKSALATILGSGPEIRWAHAEIPRKDASVDIVRLQMLSGPSHANTTHDEGIFAMLPTSSQITISGVTTGRRYWIGLNDFPYSYDAQGGDTVNDVRDALITAINDNDAEETATAASGGSGKIDLTPDVPGGIWELSVSPTSQMSIAHGGTERIRVVTGDRISTISLQAFKHSKILSASAHSMIAQIKSGLDLESVKAILLGAGVSILAVGPTVDLTAIAGAHFETRAQFDLTISQKAVLTEQISTIESVFFDMLGQSGQYPAPP